MYDSAARQARRRFTRNWWALPVLVAVVFVLLQGFAGQRVAETGDSEQYGRISLELSGVPRAEAEREAWHAWCESQALDAAHTLSLDPVHFRDPSPAPKLVAQCMRQFSLRQTTASRRYDAIFDARIGFPLLAVPAVRLLGVRTGLWATSVVLTGMGGFLLAALLTAAGVGLWGAVAGELLFLCGPIGQWGVHPLAEGALNTAVLLCLLGAWWLLTAGERAAGPAGELVWRGAGRSALLRGSVVSLLGLAAVALVKYSSATLLGAALALVAGLCRLTVPRTRHRGTLLLGAGGLVLAVVAAAVGSLLGAPGAHETLQDTFTRHFRHPDAAHPWVLLAKLNVTFWWDWLRGQASSPALLVLGALGCRLLFRQRPVLGWLSVAGAVLGMLTVAAHPVIWEFQRLGVLEWLPAVLGLPFLLSRIVRPRSAGRAEEFPREPLNQSA